MFYSNYSNNILKTYLVSRASGHQRKKIEELASPKRDEFRDILLIVVFYLRSSPIFPVASTTSSVWFLIRKKNLRPFISNPPVGVYSVRARSFLIERNNFVDLIKIIISTEVPVPLVPESVVVIILHKDWNFKINLKQENDTLKRLLSFRSSKDVRPNLRTDILFILWENI